MTRWRASTAVIYCLLSSCGPEAHFETLDEDCHKYCADVLVDCIPPEDQIATPDLIQRCEAECEDNADEALRQGNDCAQTFENLLSCVVELTCAELGDWGVDIAGNECESETASFRNECSRVWVAH
jgi:hypothetical protein